jgi:hypothetical protein
MDEPKYFNEFVRCYADGTVERIKQDARIKNPQWRPVKNKPRSAGYFYILIDGKYYLVHRIIASCFLGLDIGNPNDVIDHRDGNPTNNCVANLRITTKQGNGWNQPRAKGYYWHKESQKWQAQIRVNNNNIHLGYFDTEEAAHQAYLAAKLIHHVIPERPLPHQ